MRARRYAVGLLVAYLAHTAAAASPAQWAPVAQEELALHAEPKAPSAPAIYLYRQVDCNDELGIEDNYDRVKILTSAGLDLATVVIVTTNEMYVENVQARTIRSDGSVVEFDGKVYRGPAGAGPGSTRLSSTTFTLPAVDVGSIIEYRYSIRHSTAWVSDSSWMLSERLFTRAARFSMIPSKGFILRTSWPHGLPPGVSPPVRVNGQFMTRQFVLEAHDLDPYVEEGFAPPEKQLRYRVDFIYANSIGSGRADTDPVLFWNEYANHMYWDTERFVNASGAMKEALKQIVQPGDSPETQVRKIYARVQQIRYVPQGERMTKEETQEEQDHRRWNVSDVWQRGRGTYGEIDLLFLALVRAAGLPADLLFSPRRDEDFFDPRSMNPNRLVGRVIAVSLDGREIYFDPGDRRLPFGMLAWEQTALRALRIKRVGGDWVMLPSPSPTQTQIVRHVALKYSSSQTLEGTAEVSYTGAEALWRRKRELNADAQTRRKFLEDDLAANVPVKCTVKLLNDPDWDGSDTPLVARFNLSIPGWTQTAGSHVLFPAGLFGASERTMFVAATRVNPLYFWYPYTVHDEVVVQLPAGWHVVNSPKPLDLGRKVFRYQSHVSAESNVLKLTREIVLNALLLPASDYDSVKEFFDSVRAADDERAVISIGEAASR